MCVEFGSLLRLRRVHAASDREMRRLVQRACEPMARQMHVDVAGMCQMQPVLPARLPDDDGDGDAADDDDGDARLRNDLFRYVRRSRRTDRERRRLRGRCGMADIPSYGELHCRQRIRLRIFLR